MAQRQRILLERQARMNLILDGAEKLFVKKGYNDTCINDIAQEADFSRTSVYQYFSNKEEIYLCILERYTDLLTERLTEATSRKDTALEKIRAPVLGLYGEDDARVNTTVGPARERMQTLGKTFGVHTYAGAGHAFLRAQGGREGANLAASRQAWPVTVTFLRNHLESD